jgi:hypothetical protein
MNVASVLTDACRVGGAWIVNILKTLKITDDNSQHVKYFVSFLYYKCVGKKERVIFLPSFWLSISLDNARKVNNTDTRVAAVIRRHLKHRDVSTLETLYNCFFCWLHP